MRSTAREKLSKYPVLGEVQILGSQFRSTSYQKNESELIIIVTPRLVRPLDGSKAVVPTDGFVEPSELEFYGFGKAEGKATSGPRSLEGQFGHVNP